jgi:hypothetical protein
MPGGRDHSGIVASTATKSECEFIAELDAHKDLLNLDQVKLSPANAPGANLEAQ